MSKEHDSTTHFGYKSVSKEKKQGLVNEVFNSVAKKYDIMNDLMSFGIHRIWKDQAIEHCSLSPTDCVLDLAAGTCDLTKKISNHLSASEGVVVASDINFSMLKEGKDKLINQGVIQPIKYAICDGTYLSFADNSFDCVIIAFGLRNITDQDKCLSEINRVLKPGGRLVILEFSKPKEGVFNNLYELYSFNILPKIGSIVANDQDSYQYLAESIRKHPNQETLKQMMQNNNFELCSYTNLTNGICAIHKGFKCS